MKPTNPFTSMLAVFDARRFFGRGLVLTSIIQGISATEPSSFSISGIRTIGKTALLRYLAHPDGAVREYEDFLGREYAAGGNRALLPLYLSFRDFTSHDNLLLTLAQHLEAEAVRSSLVERNLVHSISESGSQQELVDAAVRLLERFQDRNTRVVFLLDDFDSVVIAMDTQTDGLLRHLTHLASFVIATEEPMARLRPDLAATSPLFNIMVPRIIELLSEEEAQQLVIEPAREAGDPFCESEVDFLLDIAGCHPFLLTVASELLYELRTKVESLRSACYPVQFRDQFTIKYQGLPPVHETYLLFWNRLVPSERKSLVRISQADSSYESSERTALQSLRNKALIYEDFGSGDFRVFGSAFADFVGCRREALVEEHSTLTVRALHNVIARLSLFDASLLTYLVEQSDSVCTYEDLARDVWNDSTYSRRSLEAAVSRLRNRLAELGSEVGDSIVLIRGKGYMFETREADDVMDATLSPRKDTNDGRPDIADAEQASGRCRTMVDPRVTELVDLRLQHLSDNLREDLMLLRQYENALRFEDDPRRQLKYRQQIEQLHEALVRYQEEYDGLCTGSRGQRALVLQDISLLLEQMSLKLDILGTNHEAVHDDIKELRQAVIDHIEASEQVIVSSVVARLDREQLDTVGAILHAIDVGAVAEGELLETLSAVEHALIELQQSESALRVVASPGDVAGLAQMVNAPELDLKHKIKWSVPIVPLILAYEGEVELKSGLNLKSVWERLVAKARRKA